MPPPHIALGKRPHPSTATRKPKEPEAIDEVGLPVARPCLVHAERRTLLQEWRRQCLHFHVHTAGSVCMAAYPMLLPTPHALHAL
jgi:hypothetical protein